MPLFAAGTTVAVAENAATATFEIIHTKEWAKKEVIIKNSPFDNVLSILTQLVLGDSGKLLW